MQRLYSFLFILMLLIGIAGCSDSVTSGSSEKSNAKLVGGEIGVSTATDDQQNPRVVFLPDKNLYFSVWEDYRNRNTSSSDIYGQFLDQSGNVCNATPILISHNASSALQGNQTAPDVAYKQDITTPANSKLMVVWQDSVGTTSSGYVGYATITTLPTASTSAACAAPSMVTGPATVSSVAYMNYNQTKEYSSLVPQIATVTITNGQSTGSVNLVPYAVPGSVTVTGSFIQTLANPTATPPVNQATVQVTGSDNSSGEISGSGLASSSNINYSTGQLQIVLSSSVASGAADATLAITYNSYTSTLTDRSDNLLSRKSPRISYDPNRDEFWATWVESRNANNISSVSCFGVPVTWQYGDSNYIGYARIKGDGTGFQTISLPGNDTTIPTVNIVGADIIRNTQSSMNRLLSSLSTSTTQTFIYEYFLQANNPVIASDPTSPETLIAWEGISKKATISCVKDPNTGIVTSTLTQDFTNATSIAGDGVHIYSIFDKQIFLPNTYSTWVDFQNNAPVTGSGTAVTTGSNPSVAVDNTSTPRKFLIAWEDNRNGNSTNGANTKIFGQLINSGGGIYNTNRIISYQDSAGTGSNDLIIQNSRQTKPFVSFDAVNQRFFVMWQDERNSSTSSANIDLYGQFFNLEGSLSGSNYAISSNPSNQLAPAIAYDPFFKQFLAVWKDARNINPPGTSASDVYGQIFSIGQPQLTLLNSAGTVQLVPAIIDFGAITTGTTVQRAFLVKNTGDVALNIDSITTLPSNPFTIAPTNSSVLAPGASATYTVTYTPTSSGSYNSSFKISSNGGSQVVALSATGVGLNTLNITSPSTTALPDASTNGLYSIQMVAAGGFTPFTWNATGLPTQLSISPTTGLISGSNLTAGNYNLTVSVTDGSSPAATVSRNYTLRVGSISVNTSLLSAWTQGVDYSNATVHSLTATGGTGNIAWMILTNSGTLPTGITMSNSGVFSGIASTSGTYSFTVVATDSATVPQSVQAPASITINPSPYILTSSLPSVNIGQSYSQTLSMTGGTLPVSWNVSGGMPPGLTLNSGSGVISGTPTTTGTFPLTVSVVDFSGATVSKSLSITINSSIDIATATAGSTAPATAVVGTPYSMVLKTNNGGTSPYTWTTTSGVLPTGLSLDKDTGTITGTPTTAGEYTFIATVTDQQGATASKTFTIWSIATGTQTNVQLIGNTGTLASFASVATSELTNVPAGYTPANAVKMTVDAVPSGSTVSMAVTFPSIPVNAAFHKISGNTWTLFTPDSIVGNTVFYQVKDRISANDTDPLALRDTNPAPGIIEDPIVVSSIGTTPSGGTGSAAASGGGGGGCFIATAAFGSYLDPHVMVLRHFRDNVLLQSELGTAFVKFYYKHSPPIADFIAQHDSLRMIMRFALTPLIFAVKFPLVAALLFAVAVIWVIRRKLPIKSREGMAQQAG